ncbi:MAG TPA: hypothetical protein VFP52_01710, partial [Myxococcales bacterium]|nr:hypothetical protein [Myxococcales bacterium]
MLLFTAVLAATLTFRAPQRPVTASSTERSRRVCGGSASAATSSSASSTPQAYRNARGRRFFILS